MPTFSELVKNKAIESRLPFGVEFEIKPDFPDAPTETVAGLQIPVFKELLVQEAWFFEVLAEATNNRKMELQTTYTTLVTEFKKFMAFDTYKEAYENLFAPSEEIREDSLFQEFNLINQDKILRITELVNLMNNDQVANWMRVAFFLASRVGAEWSDLGKAARLRVSQIKELSNFILKESNGGVIPESVEESEAEDEGKDVQLPLLETTDGTTGKSKK
jgi:hypothetical protein